MRIIEFDCSKYPEVIGSSLILRGNDREVFDTILRMATSCNGHQDTPELRKQLKGYIRQTKLIYSKTKK